MTTTSQASFLLLLGSLRRCNVWTWELEVFQTCAKWIPICINAEYQSLKLDLHVQWSHQKTE
ncbi:hypothetical protein CFP56_039142 [Quercus suber]|uniref:Uncharacterized protein n=1 Tax=Quercus suber TaxID=58331 RepID=A0AAW0LMS3_QUESU